MDIRFWIFVSFSFYALQRVHENDWSDQSPRWRRRLETTATIIIGWRKNDRKGKRTSAAVCPLAHSHRVQEAVAMCCQSKVVKTSFLIYVSLHQFTFARARSHSRALALLTWSQFAMEMHAQKNHLRYPTTQRRQQTIQNRKNKNLKRNVHTYGLVRASFATESEERRPDLINSEHILHINIYCFRFIFDAFFLSFGRAVASATKFQSLRYRWWDA